MNKKRYGAVLALVGGLAVLGFFTSTATAGEKEIGILGGVVQPDNVLDGADEIEALYGVRGAVLFGDRFGWFADFTLSSIDPNTGSQEIDLTEYRTGVEIFLNPAENRNRWFISTAVGQMDLDMGTAGSFDRLMASVGVGSRMEAGEHSRWRWELRGERSIEDDGLGGETVQNLELLAGWSWGFGGTPADSDGDGVRDRKDACPDTPAGAVVDTEGCPSDRDDDGVLDGLDRCPDTPEGVHVDGNGCPTDLDGDGVFDGPDRCPDTPKGAAVDVKGCPSDDDGDGVLDGLDKCPDTPKGAAVDARGCPSDHDHDGVLDGLDKCPDTPNGVKVDGDGCPVAKPLFEEKKAVLVLEGVNFETNSAVLTEGARTILDKVAESLKAWPDVRVEVAGHTDAVGRASYNKTLSGQRAEAVRAYLEAAGVDSSRLEARGYGEESPAATNETEEGRAVNRRVELKRLN